MPEEVKALTAYVEFKLDLSKLHQQLATLRAELATIQPISIGVGTAQLTPLREAVTLSEKLRDHIKGASSTKFEGLEDLADQFRQAREEAAAFQQQHAARLRAAQVPLVVPTVNVPGLGGIAAGGGAVALGAAGAAASLGVFAATVAVNQRQNESYVDSLARMVKGLVGLSSAEDAAANRAKALTDNLLETRQAAKRLAEELAARNAGGAAPELLRARQRREDAEGELARIREEQAAAGARRRASGYNGTGQGTLGFLAERLPVVGVAVEAHRVQALKAAEQEEKLLAAKAVELEKTVALLREDEQQRTRNAQKAEEEVAATKRLAERTKEVAAWQKEMADDAAARGRMGGQRMGWRRAGGTQEEGAAAINSLLGGDLAGGLAGMLRVGNITETKSLREQQSALANQRLEIYDRFKPQPGRSSLSGLADFGRGLLTDSINSTREAAERDKDRNKLLEENNRQNAAIERAIQNLKVGVAAG